MEITVSGNKKKTKNKNKTKTKTKPINKNIKKIMETLSDNYLFDFYQSVLHVGILEIYFFYVYQTMFVVI